TDQAALRAVGVFLLRRAREEPARGGTSACQSITGAKLPAPCSGASRRTRADCACSNIAAKSGGRPRWTRRRHARHEQREPASTASPPGANEGRGRYPRNRGSIARQTPAPTGIFG